MTIVFDWDDDKIALLKKTRVWIITFWDVIGAERKLYDKTYSSFA